MKHRAIFAATYGAGLRISETCGLQTDDIDSGRGRIMVRRAKGNKDRYVLLSPLMLSTLRDYYREFRPSGTFLFPGRKVGHINPRSFNKVLDRASLQLGLTPKATPHHLRHAFATHMLELGTDVRVLQILLGHAEPQSTEHYLTVSGRLFARVPCPLDALAAREAEALG